MHIKTVILLVNFPFGLINFVNLSTTFIIQLFIKFFIFFHKKTRFLTFFILGVTVFHIYGFEHLLFIPIRVKTSPVPLFPPTTVLKFLEEHAGSNRQNTQRRYLSFVSTDDGRVLKAFNKGRGPNIETVVVEVLHLFPNGAPITSLRVSRDHGHVQKKLIAVSRDEIRSMSLHRCHLKTSCRYCI